MCFKISDAARLKIRDLLEAEYPVKVAHNAKFDIKFARVHLGVRRMGKIFCTELMYRLVMGGLEWKRASLVRAAAKYIGVVVEKEEQRSDWSKKTLTTSQLGYAANDAYILLPIRVKILAEIVELELVNAARLELEALDEMCHMELNGFGLSRERWLEADISMTARRLEIAEEIWTMLEGVTPQKRLAEGMPLFKIGSQKIMTELLSDFGIKLPENEKPKPIKPKVKKTAHNDPSAGLLFSDASFTGNTVQHTAPVVKKQHTSLFTTRNWKIKPLADRFQIISMLIEWRELNKRNTSYGKDYLSNINEITGRIHSDYDPLRAVTGRYASSKPNLQQIPKLKAYRRCFMPAEGYVFVSADYSQIELRELAEFSGDEGFIAAFKSGLDFHDATTLQMFGDKLTFPNGAKEPPAKKTPEYEAWEKTESYELWTKYRTYAKNINFGIPYGMGAMTLSIRTGMSFKEAQQHLENYKKRFPKVIAYLNACAWQVYTTREIRTSSGRLCRFNFDPNDEAAVAHAKNNGKNTPIQGGNADILKRAMRLLQNALHERGFLEPVGGKIQTVNIVHDEIVLEVQIGYEPVAQEILEAAMKAAGEEVLKIVPIKVEAATSVEWGK